MCVCVQVENLRRNRKRRNSDSMILFVKGKDSSVPRPSPVGLCKVKEWLVEQLEQLEVCSHTHR